MPNKKIFPLALLALLAFAGCKKETAEGDNNGPESNWTFSAIDYSEGSMPTTCSSTGIMSSSDDNANSSIVIEFGAKPTIDGTYATTSLSDTSTLHSNRCSIDLSVPSKNYKSSGSSIGGSVQVSVAGNGKVTAIFNNIEMQDISNTTIKKSLSGTLIEK